jgi:hypothetical protein
MTVTKSLDEIMSERVEPREEEHETEVVEQGPERAEDGKFKAKTEEQPEEPVTDPDEPEEQPETGKVPQQALHSVRQREKETRQENEDLRRQLAQLQGQFSTFMQMQQKPQAPVEEAKPVDFWEDPDAFVKSQMTPFQQEMQQQREYLSQELAVERHGRENVEAAYQALASHIQADPNGQADYQRIMQHPLPYVELVNWHQRRQAFAEIGNDPAAYREKVRNELLAEMQAQQPTQQQPAPRPQMPNSFAAVRNQGSRATTTYQGPKPLSEITRGQTQ